MTSSSRTVVACLLGFTSATAAAFAKHEAMPPQLLPAAPTQVTFNRDIAPIIHLPLLCPLPPPRGSWSFPLLTYRDARERARQIAALTATRLMPPWLPEVQELRRADELRLSDEQIALIQKWVQQGAIEGGAADLAPAPQFAAGWQMGRPDKIIEAEKPHTLPTSGSDMYWNFIFRAPVDGTRWVRAIEIRPGDKRVVHHANVLVDREQSSRRQEKEPGAGFPGMELKIESESFDPDSHFFF